MESLLELIQVIYQNPTSRDHHTRILAALQEKLSLSSGASLIEFSLVDGSANTTDFVGIDPQAIRQFDDHYCRINPIMKNATPTLSLHSVICSNEVVDNTEWLSSEFYNDFVKTTNTFHVAGSVLATEPLKLLTLSVNHSKRQGPFTEDDLRLLEIITPHLGNRMEIVRQFRNLERSRLSLETALDTIGVACIIADQRGKVHYFNRNAQGILSRRDGLELSSDSRLVAKNTSSAAALRRTMVEAITLGKSQALRIPSVARIERPSGKSPYHVFAFPANPLDASPDAQPLLTLLIKDPSAEQLSLLRLLEKLHGLTPAEARVALHLLDGKSAAEIAVAHRVSLNTVRTQIRVLLAKTGTRRQGELVANVYRSLAWSLQYPG